MGPDDIQRDVLPIPDIPTAGGLDDHNHMIAPEARVSLAMGLQ